MNNRLWYVMVIAILAVCIWAALWAQRIENLALGELIGIKEPERVERASH